MNHSKHSHLLIPYLLNKRRCNTHGRNIQIEIMNVVNSDKEI